MPRTIFWPIVVHFVLIIHAAFWSVVAGVMCAIQLNDGHLEATAGVVIYPILFAYCLVWCCMSRSDWVLVYSKVDVAATIICGISSLVVGIWNTWFCMAPTLTFLFLSIFLAWYVVTRRVMHRWSTSIYCLSVSDHDANNIQVCPYVLPMTVNDNTPNRPPAIILRRGPVAAMVLQEQMEATSRHLATLAASGDVSVNSEAQAQALRCIHILTEIQLLQMRSRSLAPSSTDVPTEVPRTGLTVRALAEHNAAEFREASEAPLTVA
ncbi:hypothetical protein CcaverHIS002_0401780 [Cutaneotrichosporon cavernicola]|uniref:Transmembrane protein n=1 Tax=Cutaneotrichosporon cavernicola TaxID=279322 RepID=A0AA48QVJ0_9TREE|nr:uncharacterized protein CcaverHIS019_0401730 [Cutaneotrichosporon cavernicola]BEI83574.1 hypothetical protein CcaverHIS002_0401780 [Cutaneotrichosporon cavernicola]BEI91353.1 hypothetical protein CcaverHIS019_0401730 [Cutaneotrichosporon cavernicola]BEI99126.1 hypothetical protein CcaverHIS631_0401690 [Cutaneotrichosporon cavernicola]BEJ06901.1 hypothetical protein CcaverHIS641_0401700 [Cutaneotrichosporon cavernicola]